VKLKLSEIARLIGGQLIGDGEIEISGANSIIEAGPGEISFAVPPHTEKAADSKAAAIIFL
jgi:UDP-3-O-[3-hydroxymyristoyl] glucosamine N-acyltransferase